LYQFAQIGTKLRLKKARRPTWHLWRKTGTKWI